MESKEALFKKHYPEIKRLVDNRQSSWKLTTVAWEDVSAVIIERIWNKFDLYEPSKPLDRWVNTVITNAIANILRQNLWKTARPCVAATAYGNCCVYNMGSNRCSWTKSGLQDSTCHFFANWEKKKQAKFAISTPLSIENHTDESHSIQEDFLDIDKAKRIIDEKIMPRLSKDDAKIYRMLYIEHMEMEDVGIKMGYKKTTETMPAGYLQIRSAVLRIKQITKEIINEEDLAI